MTVADEPLLPIPSPKSEEIPLRGIFTIVPELLSLKLSAEFRFPALDGLKETMIVQLPFTPIGVEQVSVSVNSEKPVAIFVTLTGAVPLFVIRIGRTLGFATLAIRDKELGEIERDPATPFSAVLRTVAPAVTVSMPVCCPATEGTKETWTLQNEDAATEPPQVSDSEKPGAITIITGIAALDGFEMIASCGVAAAFNCW